MNINKSIEDGKRIYELVLSRFDFDHLCAGCPETDYLYGTHRDGASFQIFNNPQPRISNRITRINDAYVIGVGAEVPLIPSGATNEDVDRLTQQFCDNLENAINNSNKIPIESEMSFIGKMINLGYVKLKVEPNILNI